MKLETEFLLGVEGVQPAFRPEPQFTAPPESPAQAAAVAAAMQQLIDDLPEQIALLDERCEILAVNRAWRQTVEEHGYREVTPGGNYRDFCARKAAEGYEPAVEAVAALDDISAGKRSFWQLIYNGRENWQGRDFQISIHRIEVGAQNLISVTRFDLTEILELRRTKDDLTHSLTKSQAVERQRMARELHDSTSQLLAGIGLLLGRLRRGSRQPEVLDVVDEVQKLLGEAQQEIRSISYLAHPPALEKLGLTEAIKSLVEGFGRRTSLGASFEIQGEGVVSPEAQSAIYRIVQEALANVHRHARAARVRILLCFRRLSIHLIVADDGVGITQRTLDAAQPAGVGLVSMRSRLAEVGGRLSIRRLSAGTAIIASLRR